MDPDACLQEILETLASPVPDRDRAIELIGTLHMWLLTGGFLPQASRYDVDTWDGEAVYIVGDR